MRSKIALSIATLAVATLAQCPPSINQDTVNLMEGYETFQPNPYDDGYGNITVGYGHKCSDDSCSEVPYNFPMSESEASDLFQNDLYIGRVNAHDFFKKQFENCITNAIYATLNDNQYGALVSWTFNVGCGNMQSSTLVRRLNNGEDPNTVAQQELPRWNKANGQTSNGLTRRRAAEVDLFTTYSDYAGIPCSNY